MPISNKKLSIDRLLCHDGVYKLMDIAGRLKFENWDMQQFEKEYLGCDECRYIRNSEDMRTLMYPLVALDVLMPFYGFDEEGQHYGYELFLCQPDYWNLRGEPFFWAYTSRKFTYDDLPMSQEAFSDKYMSIVQELNIPY